LATKPIPKNRRRHAAEKKNAKLEALHRVGVSLAASFDIDAILQQIHAAAVSLLGEDPVDVYYDGSRSINAQSRWFPASPGSRGLSHPHRLRLERAVRARVTETIAEHEIIPIAVQDQPLGALVVRPSRPLRQEDRGLLSILGLQAATALHNIHLQQERIQFERLSAIGRMIGSVVHDFRSPLTAVRGYAGMLASIVLSSDDRHQYSQLIIEECDRLSALTDELLELTRSSGSKPNLTTMELGDFFRQVVPSLEAQFKNSQVSLRVELGYDGPARLDANRMMRAILNVATNARQAIEGTGSFTIRSKRRLGQVILEFEDNGAGIPAAVLHRIFEPFFSHGKASGIGLGMSIIQKIVEEHGGETVVSSKPGVGTTVRFLLPLAEVAQEDARSPAGSQPASLSRSFR
jgi:signal transduction histidine kinase